MSLLKFASTQAEGWDARIQLLARDGDRRVEPRGPSLASAQAEGWDARIQLLVCDGDRRVEPPAVADDDGACAAGGGEAHGQPRRDAGLPQVARRCERRGLALRGQARRRGGLGRRRLARACAARLLRRRRRARGRRGPRGRPRRGADRRSSSVRDVARGARALVARRGASRRPPRALADRGRPRRVRRGALRRRVRLRRAALVVRRRELAGAEGRARGPRDGGGRRRRRRHRRDAPARRVERGPGQGPRAEPPLLLRDARRRVAIKSSTRLQCARIRQLRHELFVCAPRTRRGHSIRPKVGRIDFDATELERCEVWSRPSSPFESRAGTTGRTSPSTPRSPRGTAAP